MKPSDDNQATLKSKKLRAFFILGIVVIVGLTILYFYREYARTHVSTDDAFVKGAIHLVSPRVTGTVIKIMVTDNQPVKAGDPLASLDPEPFRKAVDEAEAEMKSEEGRLREFQARIEVQERKVTAMKASLTRTQDEKKGLLAAVSARSAQVKAKEASFAQSRLDLTRAENLSTQEVIPKSRYDRAKTAYEMADAALAAARELEKQAQVVLEAHKSTVNQVRAQLKAEQAALISARAALATQTSQVSRRKAQLESARLKLAYTEITAPADGFVTHLSTEIGNTVQAGQPLMSVVNLDDAYVVANYKETKVGRFEPGQKVIIKIDSQPGRKFKGTLNSIMAGTGSAFTLFPPENASGNYVKVVQRIPVKITFNDMKEVEPVLKVGMSVVPTVYLK